MLKIIKRPEDLDIRQLMHVYEETNRINGAREYGNLAENLQVLYAEQDFYGYLRIFFSDRSSRYAVWAPEGIYKAAVRMERYCDSWIITGLETAPEERRRGYAAALLGSVIAYMKENDPAKLYSHIENTNFPSLQLHEKIGFQKISNGAIYIDGSFHNESCTYCMEIK